MNPRTAKEVRHLVPASCLALSAGVVSLWDVGAWSILLMGSFVLACAIMAAESFGIEFRQRTLPMLLTEPIPRSNMWREKMVVLGIMLAATAMVFGAIIFRRLFSSDFQINSETVSVIVAFLLIPVCAFCATPFWSLLFKNTLIAASVSLGAPAAILLFNGLVHELFRKPGVEFSDKPLPVLYSAFALLGIYSVVTYWSGYRRFKSLQLMESSSRDLQVPDRIESAALRPLRVLFGSYKGPAATLLRKELRLQQIPIAASAIFFGIALLGAMVYAFRITSADGTNVAAPLLWTDFGIYISLFPFLVGAISIAEEKTWGVSEWHLTLPPAVRKQWIIKIAVALSTSIVLGLAFPAVLAALGKIILYRPPQGAPAAAPTYLLPFQILFFAALHLLLTGIVIYSATLCRSSVAAVILSMGILFSACTAIGGIVALFEGNRPFFDFEHPESALKIGLSGAAAGMLLLLCCILYFAYRGYRSPRHTAAQVASQAIVLLAVLCTLTFGVLFAMASATRLQP